MFFFTFMGDSVRYSVSDNLHYNFDREYLQTRTRYKRCKKALQKYISPTRCGIIC